MRILGVDPGPSCGALAVLDAAEDGSLTLAGWAEWSRRRSVTCGGCVEAPRRIDTPTDLRRWVPPCDVAAVEHVHVGRVRGAQLVALAESSGAWVEVARGAAPGAPLRPSAREWRATVGARQAPGVDDLVRRLLELRFGLAVSRLPCHAVDAVGVAVWVARRSQEAP